MLLLPEEQMGEARGFFQKPTFFSEIEECWLESEAHLAIFNI
jgi:hypothetical protein